MTDEAPPKPVEQEWWKNRRCPRCNQWTTDLRKHRNTHDRSELADYDEVLLVVEVLES